jgi:hypothetical protein
MIVTDLFESAPEQGMAEYSLNELSSDLLQKSAQVAKNKSRQAMDPNIHDALGGGYMNPLAKHYDSLSQKFNDKAVKVGQRDAVKKIASPAVMRKIGMIEQGMAEAHGNYAGDTPVNLGGVSMKMIQAGDTVKYIDQQAQVVDMSQDRKYSRITIPSSSTTKTVLTSDLRQLGQGMAEGSKESYIIVRTDAEGKKDVFAGNFDTYERAQKELDACLAHPLHTKYKQKFEIKRKGQQGVSEADDEHLDEFNLKDLGSKIFGSRPNANANAAPGSLSPIDSAYMLNPATRKPYTGAELRAASAQRAKLAAASTAPAASAQKSLSVVAPAPSVANVPAGYSKVTQSFKKPSTTPAAPNAAGTIGTYNKKTGAATLGNKPMLAFKDLPPNIQKQLAGITEALAQPVAKLLQMVETKEDVQRIKKFIDDTFVKHGAVNESAFVVRNQILEHVTQVGAQRRRDFAAQRPH